ncbi:MAG: Ribosomal large subunit pseudouridine synthase [Planctomycetota bacterium]
MTERSSRRPAPRSQPKRVASADHSQPSAPTRPTSGAGDAVEPGSNLVRLNKLLADHGVASRRRCDELIAEGGVMVDGEVVVELGTKVDPEKQVVDVEGRTLDLRAARKRYYMLNKPPGVVCTNEVRETRPRAVDLITDPWKGRIYTIGRLDEESRGLILLTNDGEFAHRIMHPRHGVLKTYRVKVAGKIDDEALTKIREGVRLSEGRTSGARIVVESRRNDSSQLEVTIQEGMNREIRRAFAKVGYKVVDLERVRIGSLTSRGLKTGRWRELVRAEVDALLAGAPAEGGERARFGVAKRGKGRKPSWARHLVEGGRAVAVRPEAAELAARRADRQRWLESRGLDAKPGFGKPRGGGKGGERGSERGAPARGDKRRGGAAGFAGAGPRGKGPRDGGAKPARGGGARKRGPGDAPPAPMRRGGGR